MPARCFSFFWRITSAAISCFFLRQYSQIKLLNHEPLAQGLFNQGRSDTRGISTGPSNQQANLDGRIKSCQCMSCQNRLIVAVLCVLLRLKLVSKASKGLILTKTSAMTKTDREALKWQKTSLVVCARNAQILSSMIRRLAMITLPCTHNQQGGVAVPVADALCSLQTMLPLAQEIIFIYTFHGESHSLESCKAHDFSSSRCSNKLFTSNSQESWRESCQIKDHQNEPQNHERRNITYSAKLKLKNSKEVKKITRIRTARTVQHIQVFLRPRYPLPDGSAVWWNLTMSAWHAPKSSFSSTVILRLFREVARFLLAFLVV